MKACNCHSIWTNWRFLLMTVSVPNGDLADDMLAMICLSQQNEVLRNKWRCQFCDVTSHLLTHTRFHWHATFDIASMVWCRKSVLSKVLASLQFQGKWHNKTCFLLFAIFNLKHILVSPLEVSWIHVLQMCDAMFNMSMLSKKGLEWLVFTQSQEVSPWLLESQLGWKLFWRKLNDSASLGQVIPELVP